LYEMACPISGRPTTGRPYSKTMTFQYILVFLS
jgi:hypothetical protein